MANENCLEGMMCPKCAQEDLFSIVSTCIAEWSDDGTENEKEMEFDDDSNCRCVECNFSGKVKDFKE